MQAVIRKELKERITINCFSESVSAVINSMVEMTNNIGKSVENL